MYHASCIIFEYKILNSDIKANRELCEASKSVIAKLCHAQRCFCTRKTVSDGIYLFNVQLMDMDVHQIDSFTTVYMCTCSGGITTEMWSHNYAVM